MYLMDDSGQKSPSKDMEKFFSNFRVCQNQFFYLKTQPIGTWKLQCAQFLWNRFKLFLQFVHWYLGWICPLRNRTIYVQKIKITDYRKLI